jgi:uncharacterized protein YegL
MPKLMGATPTQTHQTLHNFSFSAVDVKNLGASEYTLVTIVQDTSGSVSSFKTQMEACLKQIIDACKKSPRSENLLMRLVEFNDAAQELHGFTELRTIDPVQYDNILQPRGMTALNDGVLSSIEATEVYAKQLVAMDYRCNAVAFIVTDGGENNSINRNPQTVADACKRIRTNETLESLLTVLIGVGDDPATVQVWTDYKNAAGIDQFVEMGAATPAKLAKLADFISRSISSTSQALGTGQASQPLTF